MPVKPTRKLKQSRVTKRPLALTSGNHLDFQQLEDRNLLATITVNNAMDVVSPTADTSSITALTANDGGDGISLREAIAASNNTAGDDSITFDGSVFTGGANSLIRLTQGELEITDTLTIDGSTGIGIVISGDSAANDFLVDGTFVTDVDASANVLNDNLRVINFASLSGTLSISSVTVTGGNAINTGGGNVDRSGGGIYSRFGSVSVTNSTISGNLASFVGGGIAVLDADLTVTNSTISGNNSEDFGGGAFIQRGSAFLIDSTVNGNEASREGGGLLIANGSLFLTNSTVSGNGVYSSFFSDSQGGGIFFKLKLSIPRQ